MRMTTAEYLNTPESLMPQELMFGEWHVADSPLTPHQRVVGRLFRALHEFVEAHALGEAWVSPLDVILDADRALVLQPDVLFVSNERAHIVTDRLRGAPDLVVEVLSPNPRVGTTEQRIGLYARYGVRELWIVRLLERHVEVLSFAGGTISARRPFARDERIASEVLPDFDRTPASILGY